MKLDMKTVQMLSDMPDDRLWHTVHFLAAGAGVELSERKWRRMDYDALRHTLSTVTEEDIARINRITETYKTYRKGVR